MSEKVDLSDINQEDIIKAFNKFDELKERNKINPHMDAKDYILFWNSKEYPQKYIISIAYELKNKEKLDHSLFKATGNHKGAAQWCLERNGFILYADKKYKSYLEENYSNKTTINTYYLDLKKAVKIFQNIERLQDKNLNQIFEVMLNGDISFAEYDKAQQELGFNDEQLYRTLKTKAKTYLEAIDPKNSNNNIEQNKKEQTMQKQPLNQILYGPPGTGKTYNTINKALEIILPLSPKYNLKTIEEKESELLEVVEKIIKSNKINTDEKKKNQKREKLKNFFDFYKEQGQIEFVTFHQSYGYEEFVEGIKPCNLDNCENEKSGSF